MKMCQISLERHRCETFNSKLGDYEHVLGRRPCRTVRLLNIFLGINPKTHFLSGARVYDPIQLMQTFFG